MELIKTLQHNFSLSDLNRNMILGEQFKVKDAHRIIIKKIAKWLKQKGFFSFLLLQRSQSFSFKDSFFCEAKIYFFLP